MLHINRFSRLNHRLVVLKSGLGLSPDLSPLLLDLDLKAMDLNFDLDLAVFSASPLTSPRRIKFKPTIMINVPFLKYENATSLSV